MDFALQNAVMGGFTTEAQALFAKMTQQPTGTRARLYDNFIRELKNGGIFSKFDAIYLLAAHTPQAALLNIANPGVFTPTIVGTPTFNVDSCLTNANQLNYYDTGFNPSTAGGKFQVNDTHISGWVSAFTANTVMGNHGGSWVEIYPTIGGSVYTRINDNGGGIVNATSGVGFFSGARTGAGTRATYINGVSIGSVAAADGGQMNVTIRLGGSTDGSTSNKMPAVTFGGGLTAEGNLILYNALFNYLRGVRAI